jgi:hypothetical protein
MSDSGHGSFRVSLQAKRLAKPMCVQMLLYLICQPVQLGESVLAIIHRLGACA